MTRRACGNGLLIYMSIDDWIERLICDKRLFLVEPPFMSDTCARTLLVSPTIHAIVQGPWDHARDEVRYSKLRADLENFSSGGELSVCAEPFEATDEDLAILDPRADGVWDFRSRNPSPGLRLIGQFAKLDTFVALVLAPRSKPVDGLPPPLGDRNSREWKRAISDCRKAFGSLFNPFEAIQGGNVEDVLSERYH